MRVHVLSKVTRGWGQVIKLDGSLYSIDPDEPGDKSFNYTWFCRRSPSQVLQSQFGNLQCAGLMGVERSLTMASKALKCTRNITQSTRMEMESMKHIPSTRIMRLRGSQKRGTQWSSILFRVALATDQGLSRSKDPDWPWTLPVSWPMLR